MTELTQTPTPVVTEEEAAMMGVRIESMRLAVQGTNTGDTDAIIDRAERIFKFVTTGATHNGKH